MMRRRGKRPFGAAPGEGVSEHVRQAFEGPPVQVPAWQRSGPAASPAPAAPVPIAFRPRAQSSRPVQTACVFGAPHAGVTAITEILGAASNQVTVLVPDFGKLEDQVAARQDAYPDRVVLVVGVPLSAEALQGVWDMRIAAPPTGRIIEVQAPEEVLLARGATEAALRQYHEEHNRLVKRADALGARIYGVPNEGHLSAAVIRLCELLEVTD